MTPSANPMSGEDCELTWRAMVEALKGISRKHYDIAINVAFYERPWNQRSKKKAARELCMLREAADVISEVRTVRLEAAE